MTIKTVKTGYMESNIHILIEAGHAIIIDPGDYELLSKAITEELLTVDLCILTHEHCDHVLGCDSLRNATDCSIVASCICNDNLKDSRKNFSRYYNSFIEIQNKLPIDQQKTIAPFSTRADITFEKEKTIRWKEHSLYLRETPGHSPGSICIVVDGMIMFSGDTLLKEDATGTHFIGGSSKAFMGETLPWLKKLPGNITVYAGHGDKFSLGERIKRI